MDPIRGRTAVVPGRRYTASTGYSVRVLIISFLGVALSGFDSIARSVSAPVIVDDLHISVTFVTVVHSLSYLITAGFNLILGWVMQRWGRKAAFVLVLAATSITSGATAFVAGAWTYAVVGTIAGVCLSTQGPAGLLVGEETPAKRRGLYLGIMGASFPVGSAVISAVGAVILPTGNWRLLFYLTFLPIVLAGVAMFALREPARSRDAIKVAQGEGPEEAAPEVIENVIDVEKARKHAWVQAFGPDIRKQTILLMITAFLLNTNQSMGLTLGAIFFTRYHQLPVGLASLVVSVMSIGSIVGAVLVGRIGDRVNPRNLLVVCVIVGAVGIMGFAIPGGAAVVFPTVILYGVVGMGSTGVWGRYLIESFPTRVRPTCVQFVHSAWFLNGVVIPPLLAMLIDAHEDAYAALLSGALSIIGALLLLACRSFPPQRELEELAI